MRGTGEAVLQAQTSMLHIAKYLSAAPGFKASKAKMISKRYKTALSAFQKETL